MGRLKTRQPSGIRALCPTYYLPLEQRMKDYIFGAIVQAFFEGSAVEVSK